MPHWLYLFAAIVSEVAGTTCMKLSDGLTRPLPALAMFACYGLSLAALTMAVRQIEAGIAYAVWSGLGTVLITIIGIVLFRESTDLSKLLSITLIVAGVVGLRLSGNDA